MKPVTIISNSLFSYVTGDLSALEYWRGRVKDSAYARATEIDYIYVLFRELAARRFTYTPDLAEIENFTSSPKPLFENGVILHDDAGLLIRFALGEDGLVGHLSLVQRAAVEMRLCVYLYRETNISEDELQLLLVQVERAVARDFPELEPE